MEWMRKIALSDRLRIERNIRRLEDLKRRVHHLGYFVVSSNSGGFYALQDLLSENIVLGRPKIKEKLTEALIGENNQKIALDSPARFQIIMNDCEGVIQNEIIKEKRKLQELDK